ncbi:MAG: response regulator [Spirochaetales bacterium]|nr:response regulator [Spirochaetales bacterium]
MKKQILVIDDSDALRQSIYYILNEHGYSVVEAHTEEEGILKLRSVHVDLVIADDHKPYIDSEDIAKQLKSREGLKNVPLICLYSQPSLTADSCPAGMDGCIRKPFSSDTLLHEIRRLCG